MKHNLQSDSWSKSNNKKMEKKRIVKAAYKVGDKVKYWNWWFRFGYQQTKVVNYGKIIAKSGSNVTIKTEGGSKVIIPSSRIMGRTR